MDISYAWGNDNIDMYTQLRGHQRQQRQRMMIQVVEGYTILHAHEMGFTSPLCGT